ncbi:MAG: formylglycine-generating enzyme family protein, partial [bacterium]|nr:formylglycine-generating enzyme family protein [bacterium]
PVTQAQFRLWTETDEYGKWFKNNQKELELRSHHSNHYSGDRNPAESLSWWEARSYCKWLNGQGLWPATEAHADLPTETEWEYACRAGTTTEYHSGDGEAALREAGWFGEDLGEGGTHPVGGLKGNEFDLLDMHGNVFEWALDVYDTDAYRDRGVETGTGALRKGVEEWHWAHTGDDSDRVLRGGSWNSPAWVCRSAYRYWFRASYRYWDIGFRVCLLPGPDPGQPDRAEGLAEDEKRGGTTSAES